MVNYNSVSSAIVRLKNRIQKDRTMQKVIGKIEDNLGKSQNQT